MTISPYDQETRQQAVRLYFEELADGASSKEAALRTVEAVIGIKTSTISNWVRTEEKKVDVAVTQSDTWKDAELITLRKENARLKEANEILKLDPAFRPDRARPQTEVIVDFSAPYRHLYSIERICRVLNEHELRYFTSNVLLLPGLWFRAHPCRAGRGVHRAPAL